MLEVRSKILIYDRLVSSMNLLISSLPEVDTLINFCPTSILLSNEQSDYTRLCRSA